MQGLRVTPRRLAARIAERGQTHERVQTH